MLKLGLQELLIKEAPTNAGVTVKDFSIQSDSALIMVWVNSLSPLSNISITVYGILDNSNKDVPLVTFPLIENPSTSLLQRRTGIMPARGRIRVEYTGSCDYELSVRAVNAGSSDTRIVGSSTLRITQVNITNTVSVLIPASLDERNAIAIKNWSSSGTIYVGETPTKANSALGWPIGPKDALGVDIQAGVALYAVSDGPTCDIRIAESGA